MPPKTSGVRHSDKPIKIIDISTHFENIDIDKVTLENIDIDINIDKHIHRNIDIDKDILENIG